MKVMVLHHSRRRFMILAFVLIVLAWSGVAVLGLAIARQALAPVHDATADAVARAVAAQVEQAVGYGIPLGELEGVDAYLAEVMAERPNLRYLQIFDATGRALYTRSRDGAAIPEQGGTHRPLRQGTAEIGRVRVGYAEAAVAADGLKVMLALGLALVLAGIPVLEGLRCWLGRAIVEPGRQLVSIAAAGAAGDFRRRPLAEGVGELGSAAIAVGRLARHLTRRRLELEGRAEDARSEAYEEGASVRIDRILTESLRGLHLADAGSRPESARLQRPVRRLVCMGLAFVAGVMPLTPLSLLVGVAVGVFVPRLLDRLWRGLGWRLSFILGGTVSVIVVMLPLAQLLPGPWWEHISGIEPWYLSAALGGGLGMLLHQSSEGYGMPTGRAGALWEVDAAAGAAAGAVLAGVLRLVAGEDTGWLVREIAPVVMILTWAVTALLSNPYTPREAEGWLRPVEIRALLSRWNGVGLVLAAGLPAGAAVGFGLLQALESAQSWCLWAAALMLALWLGRPLTAPQAGGSRLAVRWLAALGLLAAGLPVVMPEVQMVLLGLSGGLLLTAVAGQAQRVALAEREILGEKRVLLGARLFRLLGVFCPYAAWQAGMAPDQIAGVLALVVAGGALVARLSARGPVDDRAEDAA